MAGSVRIAAQTHLRVVALEVGGAVPRLLWPKVETARPYDLSKVHPEALPRPGLNPRPTTNFPIGEAQHPRRCAGPTDRLPDGVVVYWCLSCNRRVKNYNQPFCATEHRAERQQYVRAYRREEDRDVKLARAKLKMLHTKTRDLVNLKNALVASTPERRREAIDALFAGVDDFEEFVRNVIPTDKVVVPPPKA